MFKHSVKDPCPGFLGLIGLFTTKCVGAFHFVFLMQVMKRLMRATIKDVYEESLLTVFVWVHECALFIMILLVCRDDM